MLSVEIASYLVLLSDIAQGKPNPGLIKFTPYATLEEAQDCATKLTIEWPGTSYTILKTVQRVFSVKQPPLVTAVSYLDFSSLKYDER